MKRYEVSGPTVDDENEFMVLLLEDDEPSEEVGTGTREFCDERAARLTANEEHARELAAALDGWKKMAKAQKETMIRADAFELEVRHAMEQLARAERALREAEERHALELEEVRHSLQLYLRIWMKERADVAAGYEEGLLIQQEELREVAEEERTRGTRLLFEVDPDGETLRIHEI